MADLTKLAVGLSGTARCVVTYERMAPHMGSGSAPVFASPAMVALMEAAAVDCVEKHLPAGHQSLGTHLDVYHVAATPEGLAVTATAWLTGVDGRKLTFKVEAHDGTESIGKGTHIRVVVDTPRFMARLALKGSATTSSQG